MGIADYLPHIVCSLALLRLCWWIFISEFPNTRPWRRQKTKFLDLAEELGYRVDRDNVSFTQQFRDLTLRGGMRIVKGTKTTCTELFVTMAIPGCPPDLIVRPESVVDGMARAFGSKENRVGDPDFDAAFWVSYKDESAARKFLTPEVRNSLMRWLPSIPGASLAEGELKCLVHLNTPQKIGRVARPLLSHSKELAGALNGETEESAQAPEIGPADLMLKRFARNTLVVWLALSLPALISLPPHLPGRVLQGGCFVIAALTLALYFAVPGARVLLQSLYAFLALGAGAVLLWGLLESAELISSRFFRLSDTEVVPFALVVLPATLSFWTCRHYLRALDSTTARHRGRV